MTRRKLSRVWIDVTPQGFPTRRNPVVSAWLLWAGFGTPDLPMYEERLPRTPKRRKSVGSPTGLYSEGKK